MKAELKEIESLLQRQTHLHFQFFFQDATDQKYSQRVKGNSKVQGFIRKEIKD